MAYVNQETKALVAPAIKAVLKKYGVKGTIAIRHYSTLVVNLKSGSLDIIGNWVETCRSERSVMMNEHYAENVPDHLDVNIYYIDSHYSGVVRDFLNELHDAMKKPGWRNNTDIMTDYFDISYYCDINVGQWNKAYEFTA